MTAKDGSTDVSESEKERTEDLPDGSSSDGSTSEPGEDTVSGGGAQDSGNQDDSSTQGGTE
ncbi:hypothetical protein NVV95_04270 [Herbiconiux sp. CPCC 205716]|uniref:Uncharacterized protein n=1 Tax=Herbiconiux gentiana TaxID=2970912 RepID=A0ABT2GCC1_9MICO|nr:hypothetical protein [Herbiconiux gentiana]MCS5713766.1 hypothetical protein [Herbiconiux gentiana]